MEEMRRSRRNFSSEFKVKVALEALRERHTLSELAEKFTLHPNQISEWKKEFLQRSKGVFDERSKKREKKSDMDRDVLYSKIGKLEMERDFLKKSLDRLEGL